MLEVKFDKQKVAAKIGKNIERVQKKLDAQVLKDSNYYIPKREGFLERSGDISRPGLVIWDMQYARNMYHFKGTVRKNVNPNASTKWFERAKAAKLNEWEALVQNEYEKGN